MNFSSIALRIDKRLPSTTAAKKGFLIAFSKMSKSNEENENEQRQQQPAQPELPSEGPCRTGHTGHQPDQEGHGGAQGDQEPPDEEEEISGIFAAYRSAFWKIFLGWSGVFFGCLFVASLVWHFHIIFTEDSAELKLHAAGNIILSVIAIYGVATFLDWKDD